MSIPTDYNPLGTTMQKGMWIDRGVLRGKLFNICSNSSITLVDSRCDGSGLVDGSYMFYGCSNLTHFDADLPNLVKGDHMFMNCKGLREWNIELPSLQNGNYMFESCSFSSWKVELPNLTNGSSMFVHQTGLTRWTVELPKLSSGGSMFYNARLEDFEAKLPSCFSNGGTMFVSCNLSVDSVLYILRGNGIGSDYEGIPTYTSGSHPLHLGRNTNFKNSEEIASLLNTTTPIAAGNYSFKGWTITITN